MTTTTTTSTRRATMLALLALASMLTAMLGLGATAASAQGPEVGLTSYVRQGPRVDTSIAVIDLGNDGTTRTALVSVSAKTTIPDALDPNDPFTGFGNFEITLDLKGARVSGERKPFVKSTSGSGSVDATFCAPGMATCEVNPPQFLEEKQSFTFTFAIEAPCRDDATIGYVLTARPDGHARPDVEYRGSTVSRSKLGEIGCKLLVDDDLEFDDGDAENPKQIQHMLPDRSLPVPTGPKQPTVAEMLRSYVPEGR